MFDACANQWFSFLSLFFFISFPHLHRFFNPPVASFVHFAASRKKISQVVCCVHVTVIVYSFLVFLQFRFRMSSFRCQCFSYFCNITFTNHVPNSDAPISSLLPKFPQSVSRGSSPSHFRMPSFDNLLFLYAVFAICFSYRVSCLSPIIFCLLARPRNCRSCNC